MTANEVLLDASACLNDTAQSSFTSAVLLPYLKIAWQELREILEENNIEVTASVSAAITLPVGAIDIGGPTGPALPQNLVNVQDVWERNNGTTVDYGLMTKLADLPKSQVLTNELGVWVWKNQQIQFLGANSIRDIKIDYVSNGLPDIDTVNSLIQLINAKTGLAYRTAGLAARFIGENPTRADELDGFAEHAFERALNINIKSQQSIPTRRRPFGARRR